MPDYDAAFDATAAPPQLMGPPAAPAQPTDLDQVFDSTVKNGPVKSEVKPIQQTKLEHAYNQYLEEGDKHFGPESGWYKATRLPIAGSALELAYYKELYDASGRIERGEGTDQDTYFAAQHLARQQYEAQKGIGQRTVDLGTSMPGVLAEWALTNAPGYAVKKAAEEAAGRLAAKYIGKGLTARLAKGAAGIAAEGAVRTAMLPSTYTGMAGRAVGTNEKGELKQESLGEAAAKGGAAALVSNTLMVASGAFATKEGAPAAPYLRGTLESTGKAIAAGQATKEALYQLALSGNSSEIHRIVTGPDRLEALKELGPEIAVFGSLEAVMHAIPRINAKSKELRSKGIDPAGPKGQEVLNNLSSQIAQETAPKSDPRYASPLQAVEKDPFTGEPVRKPTEEAKPAQEAGLRKPAFVERAAESPGVEVGRPLPAEEGGGEKLYHIAEYKDPTRSVGTAIDMLGRKGKPVDKWLWDGPQNTESADANAAKGTATFQYDKKTYKDTHGEDAITKRGKNESYGKGKMPVPYDPSLERIVYKGSESDAAFQKLKETVDRTNQERADESLMKEYGHKGALEPIRVEAIKSIKAPEPTYAPEAEHPEIHRQLGEHREEQQKTHEDINNAIKEHVDASVEEARKSGAKEPPGGHAEAARREIVERVRAGYEAEEPARQDEATPGEAPATRPETGTTAPGVAPPAGDRVRRPGEKVRDYAERLVGQGETTAEDLMKGAGISRYSAERILKDLFDYKKAVKTEKGYGPPGEKAAPEAPSRQPVSPSERMVRGQAEAQFPDIFEEAKEAGIPAEDLHSEARRAYKNDADYVDQFNRDMGEVWRNLKAAGNTKAKARGLREGGGDLTSLKGNDEAAEILVGLRPDLVRGDENPSDTLNRYLEQGKRAREGMGKHYRDILEVMKEQALQPTGGPVHEVAPGVNFMKTPPKQSGSAQGWIKENGLEDFPKKATDAQRRSFKRYQKNAMINEYLRGLEEGDKATNANLGDKEWIANHLEDFDQAFKDAPRLKVGTVLYRMLNFDFQRGGRGTAEQFIQSVVKDGGLNDPGFLSTSLDKEAVGRMFSKESDDGKVLLEIRAPEGTQVLPILAADTGSYPKQKEVLLDRSSKLRLVEVSTSEGSGGMWGKGSAKDITKIVLEHEGSSKPSTADTVKRIGEDAARFWETLRANPDKLRNSLEEATNKQGLSPKRRAELLYEYEKNTGIDALEAAKRSIWLDEPENQSMARDYIESQRKGGTGPGVNFQTATGQAPPTTAPTTAPTAAAPQAKPQVGLPKSGFWDDLKKLLSPASRGEAAQKGAELIRESHAKLQRSIEVARAALEEGANYFDNWIHPGLEEGERSNRFLQFTDAIEGGEIDTLPEEIRGFAQTIRDMNDARERQLADRGLLSNFVENYLGHLWQKPGSTPEEIGRQLASGKRPWAGKESFRKQRSIPTYREGIEAGLTPAEWNPVRLALRGMEMVDKSIAHHDLVDVLKQQGLRKFVKLGGKVIEGWDRLNDKSTQQLAPGEVQEREYFDKQQMDALEAFAKQAGIDIKTVMGGQPGMSDPQGVVRRFGTPEEVLIHEIGHQLADRYGLNDWANNKSLRPELEALANLRSSGRTSPEYRAYLHSEPELIANLFMAKLHAPDLLEQVAPNASKVLESFLQSHNETRGLLDVKPSLELGQRDQARRLAGPMLVGHWYMPEPIVRLLDNYLQPGLVGNRVYDAVRGFGNMLTMFQHGMSAFHAGFVAMENQISTASLGLQQLSQGKAKGFGTIGKSMGPTALGAAAGTAIAGPVGGAVGAVGGVIYSAARKVMEGSRIRGEYFHPGTGSIEDAAAVADLVKAGGRAKMEGFYQNNSISKFFDAYREVKHGNAGKLPSLLGQAMPALVEAVSKPIMEHLVPNLKTAIFADMARNIRDTLGDQPEARNTALNKAWDSVDNRLGQMTYDNMFLNKTLKDVLMVGVRSVGWNAGDIREFGGGVKDIPSSVKGIAAGQGISPRTAYLIALPMVTAFYGSLYQYLATGKGPDEPKDMFFPKTGTTNKDGTPDRVSLPSYMKDVTALFNRADEGPLRIGQNALSMATHKINPALGTIYEMLKNEDFHGAIRNPNDPIVKQSYDTFKKLLEAFEPFSAQGYMKQREKGASAGEAAQSFIGITPAPAGIRKTWEQQRAAESKQKFLPTPLQKLKGRKP